MGYCGKIGGDLTTERKQGAVATAIYANCPGLDSKQLDEINEWVRLYRD